MFEFRASCFARCVSAKRSCNGYVRRGALSRANRMGQNTLTFDGRIGKRALAPGCNGATIVATNSASAWAVRTTSLKVVRATRQR